MDDGYDLFAEDHKQEEVKEGEHNEWTSEFPKFFNAKLYIPPDFSPAIAKDIKLHKLFRGKEAKHFPLLLFKNFKSYYQRKFDDGSIEGVLRNLEPEGGFLEYLRGIMKELGDKIPSPRKMMKRLEDKRGFQLLLYLPTTSWLKEHHPRITHEIRQYQYRKYFSQVSFVLAAKLRMI